MKMLSDPKLSKSCKNVFTTRFNSPCSERSSLLFPIASNSSKKTTHVPDCAKSKTFRRFEAVSPRYEEITASNLVYNKGSPNSVATTSAHKVFPQPGGPANNNFRRGVNPCVSKISLEAY